MVVKRKTSKRSAVSAGAHKYRIVVKFDFGPFPDFSTVKTVKSKVKAKSKKIIFGPAKKGKGGYTFTGNIKYSTPAIVATKEAIENQIKAKAPGANVTVTRM